MVNQINSFFPGSEVIKLFSCSTQLSMTFKVLLNVKIDKISGVFMPPTLKKWGGHIGFGLSVCMYVRTYVFMFEISS